jgi:hypothetical protein
MASLSYFFFNIRAKSQIQVAMKQHIVNYGECGNEAFNVGKEIKTMKSRVVAFGGQICFFFSFFRRESLF